MGGYAVTSVKELQLKRALVTGGGGFLGGAIVEQLEKANFEIQVVGRSAYPWLEKKGVHCHRLDLATSEKLDEIISDVDIVFHVAAKAGIWGDYEEYFDANVIATRNLIEYCSKTNTPMVYTSSPSVIFNGKNMHKADESVDYPDQFHSVYSQTKAMAEKEVLDAAKSKQINACSLRPHLIWGPGDNHLIPRFLARGKKGSIAIVGDGGNYVDTVYVEDAARAHILAGQKLLEGTSISGEVFFISQNEPILLFDWINRFLEQADIPRVNKRVPAKIAYAIGYLLEFTYKVLRLKSEPRMTRFLALELSTEHTFNLSKAEKLLGYVPLYTMDEAFRKTFNSDYFKRLIQQL